MKFQLCCVYDVKAAIFLSPFPARTTIDAERQISASMRDPQMRETPIYRNPEDFSLHHLGEFDDESGVIISIVPPRLISPISALMPPSSTVSS